MVKLNVTGMTCQHCVAAVTRSIQAIDPGAQVQVDLATGQVNVTSQQPVAALSAAIDEAGYTVAGAAIA